MADIVIIILNYTIVYNREKMTNTCEGPFTPELRVKV